MATLFTGQLPTGTHVIQKEPHLAIWTQKGGDRKFHDPKFMYIYTIRESNNGAYLLSIDGSGIAGFVNQSDVIPVLEMVSYFNDYIKEHPDDSWGYEMRSYGWLENGLLDKAFLDINLAISLDQSNPSLYNSRAIVWGRLGNYRKVIADYNECIRLDPNSPPSYVNRGETYLALGKYKNAIADFSAALKLDPHFPQAYDGLGQCFLKQSLYDTAIINFNKAIQEDPYRASAYHWRGRSFAKLGKRQESIADLKKASRIDPSFRRPE